MNEHKNNILKTNFPLFDSVRISLFMWNESFCSLQFFGSVRISFFFFRSCSLVHCTGILTCISGLKHFFIVQFEFFSDQFDSTIFFTTV